MPSRHRTAPCPVAADPAPPAVEAGRLGRAGVYLTDEVFLYRVVRVVAGAAGEMVELEDCFLLDVVSVPLADVRRRRLRVITPAGAPA
jgi:hypothetical protein